MHRFTKLLILCILASIVANGQTLNCYYGNIHAHTAYSDGNKENNVSYDCPAEDYMYAKNSQHFDFLGISEHNHSGAGMSLPRYANGIAEANFANSDGSFVAMYGMEWGVISQGGHVILYGYDQLIGWEAGNYDVFNAISDYNGLFQKIARYTGGNAFAYLAHPDPTDYDSLLIKPLNVTNDSAIVGAAIRSGPAMSTDTSYANPSTFSYEQRYKEALSLGYHLGAGLDHDNHYTTFGRTAQSRLVVLAPSLTKSNIMSAIKNMRIYASDDWNTKVNYTINGQPLGSIFSSSGNPTISVSVTDDDGESVSSIKVYYGVPGSGVLVTQLTANTNSTTLTYTHNIANLSSYYYYLVITQPDGNKIFTSPIWYTRNDIVLPIELLSFKANQSDDAVDIEWETASETNNNFFTIESSLNGFDFESIETIAGAGNSTSRKIYKLIDTKTPIKLTNGIIYYRLKQTDFNNNSKYSDIISVNFESQNLISDLTIFPIPLSTSINISFHSKKVTNLSLILVDAFGQVVYKTYEPVEAGNNKIQLSLPYLKNGVYFLKAADTNNFSVLNKLVIIDNS